MLKFYNFCINSVFMLSFLPPWVLWAMSPENSLQSLSVIPWCQYCVRRSQEAIQGLQSEVQANEMHNTEQRCKCKIVTILIYQSNKDIGFHSILELFFSSDVVLEKEPKNSAIEHR